MLTKKLDKNNFENINSLLFVLFIFSNVLTLPIVKLTKSTLFFWAFIIFIFVYSLYINRRLDTRFVLIVALFTSIFMLNALFVNYQIKIIREYVIFFRYGILALYFAMLVKDYNKLIYYWYYIGIISFFISNFYLDYYRRTNGYMNYGINLTYSFLGFAIYHYNYSENSKVHKLIQKIFILVSFVQILIFANRSSMLICLFVLIFCELNNLKRKNILSTILKVTIGLIISIYCLLNINNILILINTGLQKLGIYSYSLTKYILTLQEGITGIITQSSGRDTLVKISLDLINESNFMPNGVGYFEYITGKPYPHNIFLELALDFGIFGIIGFVILIVIIMNKYLLYSRENTKFKCIVGVIFIYAFTRLMFSGRYWTEALFWAGIGLVIFYDSNKNIQ